MGINTIYYRWWYTQRGQTADEGPLLGGSRVEGIVVGGSRKRRARIH